MFRNIRTVGYGVIALQALLVVLDPALAVLIIIVVTRDFIQLRPVA